MLTMLIYTKSHATELPRFTLFTIMKWKRVVDDTKHTCTLLVVVGVVVPGLTVVYFTLIASASSRILASSETRSEPPPFLHVGRWGLRHSIPG